MSQEVLSRPHFFSEHVLGQSQICQVCSMLFQPIVGQWLPGLQDILQVFTIKFPVDFPVNVNLNHG